MEIDTLSLGPLQTNCYLVWCPQTLETIIIDPADDADFITQKILDLKLKPQAIILTHGHFDHVLGILELKLNFSIPVYLHHDDLSLYQKTPQNSLFWLKRKTDPVPPPDHFLKDQQVISFGQESLTVIHSSGHTPGSICLHSPKQKLLFSGDTLFQNDIGRTDFSYSDPQAMNTSLKVLSQLPPQTTVYPGHGPSTTIGQESDILNNTKI